jgi:hypothetical protein
MKGKGKRSRWEQKDKKDTRQKEEHGRRLHRGGTQGTQRQTVRPPQTHIK